MIGNGASSRSSAHVRAFSLTTPPRRAYGKALQVGIMPAMAALRKKIGAIVPERHDVSGTLLALLEPEDLMLFLHHFAGLRLFIPLNDMRGDHEVQLAMLVSPGVLHKLRGAFGSGGQIRVPLMREFRARYLRAAGYSHGQIARELGLTESGATRLLARLDGEPVKRVTLIRAEVTPFRLALPAPGYSGLSEVPMIRLAATVGARA